MLNKVIFGFGLCVFSQWAWADPEVKSELQQKLAKLETYQASFQQTVTDAKGEILQQSEGKIALSQPYRLYWEAFEPNEMQLIADGSTLWHVDPFVEQVVAIDQQNAAANHPIMLLAQHNSPLWADYEVTRLEDGDYLMSVQQSDSDFVSLTIRFDKSTLVGLSILDKMEQRNKLNFTRVQQNAEIDPLLFTFSLPKGYELDDQR